MDWNSVLLLLWDEELAICSLLLWFLHTFLLCTSICILLLILLTCVIICCFQHIWLILYIFWNPVPCSFIGDKDFLLVIWDILFYVPLFYVFLALLYEYFFSSLSFPFCLQKCGPSSSQACGICLEASMFSVLDHEVAYVSVWPLTATFCGLFLAWHGQLLPS